MAIMLWLYLLQKLHLFWSVEKGLSLLLLVVVYLLLNIFLLLHFCSFTCKCLFLVYLLYFASVIENATLFLLCVPAASPAAAAFSQARSQRLADEPNQSMARQSAVIDSHSAWCGTWLQVWGLLLFVLSACPAQFVYLLVCLAVYVVLICPSVSSLDVLLVCLCCCCYCSVCWRSVVCGVFVADGDARVVWGPCNSLANEDSSEEASHDGLRRPAVSN